MIMFQIPLPKVTAPSFTPTEMAILLDEVAHHKDNFFSSFRSTVSNTVLPDWAGCRPIGLLLIGLDRRITHWAGRQNLGCF